HEAEQHESAREEVRDVELQSAHQNILDTNRSSVPSRPSMSAAPRNSGTRKTRILAIAVSKSASSTPATVSFAANAAVPTRWAPTLEPGAAIPHGRNRHPISAAYRRSFRYDASSIIARCRPEYSSTIASCTIV